MAIKDIDTLASLLEIVGNPDKYKAKVKELQDNIKQYTEVVEAVVKLSAVNDYTQSIKNNAAESDAALAKAKEKAASIVEKASKKEMDVDARLNSLEAEFVLKFSKLESEKAKLELEAANLASELKKITESKQELNQYKKDLDFRAAILAKEESALSEKQAKLKAALA